MKLFMLQYEVDRLAALFAAVIGEQEPDAKQKERDPIKLKNGVATISIKGALYPKRVLWLDYWGEEYTVYSDIQADIAEAKYKGATSIDFEIDSPGGYVNGLYETMQAIANAGIPTRTIAGQTLASAAYMLASQTDEIVAESPAANVGSIGVATWFYVSDSVVDVTNRDSKKKRPNVSTEEGKAVVEDELDDVWAIYAEMVAEGRGITVDKLSKEYGQGAVMTARTALSKGMIDGIMQSNQPAKPAAKIGARSMNLEELKAQHPGLYSEVFALGVAAGSKDERDRVCAHLTLADGSGDLKTAHDAIRSGDGMTATVQAAHMAAAMKRQQLGARIDDNPPEVRTDEEGDNETTEAKDAKAKAAFEASHQGWVVE